MGGADGSQQPPGHVGQGWTGSSTAVDDRDELSRKNIHTASGVKGRQTHSRESPHPGGGRTEKDLEEMASGAREGGVTEEASSSRVTSSRVTSSLAQPGS